MDNLNDFIDLQNNPVFDSLAFTLVLKINGKSETVPGANVKQCQMDLSSYGFSGSLGFWLPAEQRDDNLISQFSNEDLIEIDLSIMPVLHLPEPAPEPLKIIGVVTDKSVTELHYRALSERPVLYRYYQLKFADPARVLWQQHFPCELYVKQSMSSVIKAQIPELFKVDLKLDLLDDLQPMICLGLGKRQNVNVGGINQHTLTSAKQSLSTASFYDFLIDYLDTKNAFLIYDYSQQKYLISDEKIPLTDNKGFLPHEVNTVSTCWPESCRSNTQLLNGVADNSQTELLENSLAVDGIRQDLLVRFPIASSFTNKKSDELKKLAEHGNELSVQFSQWPLQSFYPNIGYKVDNKVWGDKALYSNQSYRAYQLKINIQAVDSNQENDIDTEFTQYQLSYHAIAELDSSKKQRLPVVCPVNYPLYVEGKIVSTIGENTDKTFDIVENEDTSQPQYQVYIPLWDKNIKILFEPDYMNSHFYFPYYRDNKVLVSFDLYQASIIKVLSWGDRVRLPNATQGNHILFGKNEKDETSLRHVYEDSKPVLNIKRQKEKDTELVRLEEGSIILQTCEEK
jgi:hypothetical protein